MLMERESRITNGEKERGALNLNSVWNHACFCVSSVTRDTLVFVCLQQLNKKLEDNPDNEQLNKYTYNQVN